MAWPKHLAKIDLPIHYFFGPRDGFDRNIEMHYNTERLHPKFASFENKPFFIMGNESS